MLFLITYNYPPSQTKTQARSVFFWVCIEFIHIKSLICKKPQAMDWETLYNWTETQALALFSFVLATLTSTADKDQGKGPKLFSKLDRIVAFVDYRGLLYLL